MKFLDSIREKAESPTDRTGICETCGNLCEVVQGLIGCEAHDKLIIPEFPPYFMPKVKCKDWKQREEESSEDK